VGAVVAAEVGPLPVVGGSDVAPVVTAVLGSVGSVGCGPVELQAARAVTSVMAITVRPQTGRIASLYAPGEQPGWTPGP
jgi:hypothetical protein